MNSNLSKTTIISNDNISLSQYISSIYLHRSVIYALLIRDVKSRYTQTKLGWLWAIIQPLATLCVYSFFFSTIVKIDTGDIPYPLIALSGIIIWNYFSSILSLGSSVLVNSQSIIKNINFPKICLIIAKSALCLLDTIISLSLILIALVILQYPITYHIVYIPIILILTWAIGFTCAIWMVAFSLKKRDILNIIPHILTVGVWLTPVFYPSTLIPQQFNFLVYLNPIAGIIEGFRFVLLHTPAPSFLYLIGIVLIIALFILGIIYFKNIEKDIAEFA